MCRTRAVEALEQAPAGLQLFLNAYSEYCTGVDWSQLLAAAATLPAGAVVLEIVGSRSP